MSGAEREAQSARRPEPAEERKDGAPTVAPEPEPRDGKRRFVISERLRKYRDASEIRKLFFTALLGAMFFLIALAIRDFITDTVYSVAPREKFSSRLLAFILVVAAAVGITLLVYQADLDR